MKAVPDGRRGTVSNCVWRGQLIGIIRIAKSPRLRTRRREGSLSFVQNQQPRLKLTLGPVVFGAAIAVMNPFPWESERVLRPLRTEFPAQTVRVHSMQEGAHTVLVPVHESGNHFCGRAL